MEKNAVILLIVSIIAFVLFLVSWLVLKNIKPIDWVVLALGIADLIILFADLEKGKN